MAFNIRKVSGIRTAGTGELNAQHIEKSTSPWNSPIFIIKNKSRKWRKVAYLRASNNVI